MVEQAFGKPLEEIFSEFNPQAVGAATIGQAHEARLKGSNKPVIIKIQYPEVRRLFGLDFSTLKKFVRFKIVIIVFNNKESFYSTEILVSESSTTKSIYKFFRYVCLYVHNKMT